MNIKTRTAAAALFALILAAGLSVTMKKANAQSASKEGVEASIKKGDELYHQGKFQEAIAAYKEALNTDANNDHAIEYIGLSYNKLGDRASSRQWMQRRVDLPGQSPSTKARMMTDIALLYWDEADAKSAELRAGLAGAPSAEDIYKLISEGTDSAQKAVTIAPRSARGFNLINLLNREAALLEQDPSKQKEYIDKADAALRQCIQFFDAIPQLAKTDGMFAAPMVLAGATGSTPGVTVGKGKTTVPDALKNPKADPVTIEVFVGADGKVLIPRVLAGKGKPAEDLLAAAHKWQYSPTTFEGHPVGLVQSMTFPSK